MTVCMYRDIHTLQPYVREVISLQVLSQVVNGKEKWIVGTKFEQLTVSTKPFDGFSSKFTG